MIASVPSAQSGCPSIRLGRTASARARASADLLEQGHNDPVGPTYVGHSHAVLVLADTADEPVPVRSHRIDGRLEVADLEGHVAQAELVGHRGGRSGEVVR